MNRLWFSGMACFLTCCVSVSTTPPVVAQQSTSGTELPEPLRAKSQEPLPQEETRPSWLMSLLSNPEEESVSLIGGNGRFFEIKPQNDNWTQAILVGPAPELLGDAPGQNLRMLSIGHNASVRNDTTRPSPSWLQGDITASVQAPDHRFFLAIQKELEKNPRVFAYDRSGTWNRSFGMLGKKGEPHGLQIQLGSAKIVVTAMGWQILSSHREHLLVAGTYLVPIHAKTKKQSLGTSYKTVLFVRAYDETGKLDVTFGKKGTLEVARLDGEARITALCAENQKVLVAYSSRESSSPFEKAYVSAYDEKGKLLAGKTSTAFGQNGRIQPDTVARASVYIASLLWDEQYLSWTVVGVANEADSHSDVSERSSYTDSVVWWRYDENGREKSPLPRQVVTSFLHQSVRVAKVIPTKNRIYLLVNTNPFQADGTFARTKTVLLCQQRTDGNNCPGTGAQGQYELDETSQGPWWSDALLHPGSEGSELWLIGSLAEPGVLEKSHLVRYALPKE